MHAREYVFKHDGEATWKRLVASLPPSDQALLGGLIVSNGWYSLGAFNRLSDAYHGLRGSQGIRDVSTYIATEDMNFVFTMVLKMASPEFVIKRAPSIYHRYFANGDFEVAAVGARHWRMTLAAPLDVEQGPSATLCAYGLTSWVARAMVLTGARAAQVSHGNCRFRSSPRCEYDATW